MTKIKKIRISISLMFLFLVIAGLLVFGSFANKQDSREPVDIGEVNWWEIQSIDTVKFSRDLAREKINDPVFDAVIEKQVGLIAQTGATHVAIGTPYDEEFIPFLQKWVNAARENNINVWFRSNFSGWEGWFDYPKITRDEHVQKLERFILSNQHLFEDGDLFTPCTECENGGPGDPRSTGDLRGHREFLIRGHQLSGNAFEKIDKDVQTSFNSMNGDVAELVMDKVTTDSLGNTVTVDHYVETPFGLATDLKVLGTKSEGRVVLGEVGAPVPDLHGNMGEEEQAEWIDQTFEFLSQNNNVVGINYWTGFGGSTRLWKDDYFPRQAVAVVQKYYNPKVMTGYVVDEINIPIESAQVRLGPKSASTNSSGEFTVLYVDNDAKLRINAEGFDEFVYNGEKSRNMEFVLEKKDEGLIFKIRKLLHGLISN